MSLNLDLRLSEERCCISIGSSWVNRSMMKGDAVLVVVVVVESCGVIVVMNMMRKLLLGVEGTESSLLLLIRMMIIMFPSWLRTSWNEHSCSFALSNLVVINLLVVHHIWCC